MPQRKLTDRQRHVLMFIKNYIHEKGYPPALKDIGDGMGFSVKAAFDHLRSIEKKGYITYLPDQPRSLRIPKIHAIEVTENVEISEKLQHTHSPVDSNFFAVGGASIQIGDYLSVREQTSGTLGDIVIISLSDPVVVKPFETGDVVCGKVVGFTRSILNEKR